jgi:hypothetical protein
MIGGVKAIGGDTPIRKPLLEVELSQTEPGNEERPLQADRDNTVVPEVDSVKVT